MNYSIQKSFELESTAADKPLTAGDFESSAASRAPYAASRAPYAALRGQYAGTKLHLYVMASVTDRTTKHLVRDKKSSS